MSAKWTEVINGVAVRRLMTEEDAQEYRRLVEQMPDGSLLVEVGSYDGGSLVTLLDLIKSKKLQVLVADLFNQPMTDDLNDRGQMIGSRESFLSNMAEAGIDLLAVLKTSEEVVEWLRLNKKTPHLIFVDADHEYEPVKKDIALLWPVLPENGILSGHDFFDHHPGVKKALLEKFSNVTVGDGTGVWSIKKPKQSFAVVSLNDLHYKPLEDITWTGKKIYCQKWGYEAIHFLQPERTQESRDTEGHNQWYGFAKIKRILEVLETGLYEWVFFTECDALITNHDIKLSDIVDNNYHVLLTSNFDGINMGNLFVRNTPEAKAYLELIYSLYPKYKHAGYAEQQAVMDTREQYNKIIRIMPQKMFNSHDHFLYDHYKVSKERRKDILGLSGEWTPGDFQVHHCGFGLEKRLEFVKFYEGKIVGLINEIHSC